MRRTPALMQKVNGGNLAGRYEHQTREATPMTPPRLSLAAMLIAVTTLFAPTAFSGDCMRLCEREFMRDATKQEIQAEIKRGADIRGRGKGGATTLHFVAINGNAKVVTVLLQAGADIEAKDKHGLTPLHVSAIGGKASMIAALLEAGANIEARAKHWLTPLHNAAHWGNAETTTALLKAGADIMAKDKSGNTPLHSARKAETVIALIEAGANIEAKDKNGKTPFDLAKDNDQLKGTDAYWLLNEARY